MESQAWGEVDLLLKELVEMQELRLLKCGRRIIPSLTTDDILQPNDFQELEHHPIFRYEEGVLEGVRTVQMALWALKKNPPEIDAAEKTGV